MGGGESSVTLEVSSAIPVTAAPAPGGSNRCRDRGPLDVGDKLFGGMRLQETDRVLVHEFQEFGFIVVRLIADRNCEPDCLDAPGDLSEIGDRVIVFIAGIRAESVGNKDTDRGKTATGHTLDREFPSSNRRAFAVAVRPEVPSSGQVNCSIGTGSGPTCHAASLENLIARMKISTWGYAATAFWTSGIASRIAWFRVAIFLPRMESEQSAIQKK